MNSNLFLVISLMVIASQVSDSLTLTYLLADLASVYMTCPEILVHPIKLQLVNNRKTIWLKCLNSNLSSLWWILLEYHHPIQYLSIFTNNIKFFNRITFFCCHEIRTITLINHQMAVILGTISARVKMRVNESEAWLAKMPNAMLDLLPPVWSAVC